MKFIDYDEVRLARQLFVAFTQADAESVLKGREFWIAESLSLAEDWKAGVEAILIQRDEKRRKGDMIVALAEERRKSDEE